MEQATGGGGNQTTYGKENTSPIRARNSPRTVQTPSGQGARATMAIWNRVALEPRCEPSLANAPSRRLCHPKWFFFRRFLRTSYENEQP